MDVRESEILDEKEINRHWYYRAKAAALTKSLPRHPIQHVLDVGAGSGFFSRYLLENTSVTRATCVDPAYATDSDDVWSGKPVAFRRQAGTGSADLVLLMDVLEHVDDDLSLLKSFADEARAGTTFIVTVPAFQFLWSAHDDFLGHKRRYTIKGLLEVFHASGLSTTSIHYFYALVFPLAVAARILPKLVPGSAGEARSALKKHGAITNTILWWLCLLDLRLMYANRMFGLSIFAMLKKV